MPEKLQNIMWMGEELDFELNPDSKNEAKSAIFEFLELAANQSLSHWLY